MTHHRLAALAVLAALLCACPPPRVYPPPEPSGRCELDLAASGLFASVGSGAGAKVIEAEAELIGGPYAHGVVGDYLLQNDRIRVVVQRPTRYISVTPYGGAIIDADLKRAAGERGRDQFGKAVLLYQLGRTVNVTKVEVLNDGAAGGYAVVAATGDDTVLDYVNLNNVIGDVVPGVQLAIDPNKELPLRATTYYVLSPGETRVRMVTALCNSGSTPVVTQMGDIIDQGGESDIFNPTGCTNGLGGKNCLVDPMRWFGYQADGVAYGYRAYTFSDPTRVADSALLYITSVAGVLAEGENQAGLLTWVDSAAPKRPGSFGILAGQQRNYVRDFYVGRDLAELSSTFLALDGAPKARLTVTAQLPDGSPAPGARVAVVDAVQNRMETLIVADAAGRGRVDLPPGSYQVSTGEPGRALEPAASVTVPSSGEAQATVRLGASRRLSVSVRDPFGAPLTAKVTALCLSGSCPTPLSMYRRYVGVENLQDELAASAFVGASGEAQLPLPPGQYQVFVTRGPEYSAFPDTFPLTGQVVDLRTADASISATLARVVDSTGWLSADLHVHAVGSPDSQVPDAERVASFAAEGVDVMVSTDHDFVTDYGPVVADLGLSGSMASLIGCEVTPFDYGHHNAWPLLRSATPNGGAFDWAGGAGPSLRLSQIYEGLRAASPDVAIQMNHPRSGALSQLKVDTATGATHALPESFRVTPAPGATASDTKLFSPDFDGIEVMNGPSASYAVLNDWMTFMSRGWLKAATGVSDTHTARTDVGGYGRTWIRLGFDDVAQFTPGAFSRALKARRATVSSGPFVTMTARKVDAGGTPVGAAVEVGDVLSIAPAGGERVVLTVDVQAPEWMQFDAVELYTHTTGREALNGVPNEGWPASRILQQRTYDPTMLPLEAVPGLNGFNARRVHVTERFTVSPTADTWYVAMVRASGASRGLYPMVARVRCDSGVCTGSGPRPQAFTNAVLIDADGSGAWDDFPLKPGQGLTAAPKPAAPPPRRVPTMEEFTSLLERLLHHRHE